MSRYHIICSLGLTTILMFNSSCAERRPKRVSAFPYHSVEVELLIVCDKEFSDRFQTDRQKMIDYWAVYMRDVHTRFQTLHNIYINFRVVYLTTIHNAEDQPFIENARERNGNLLLSLVYREFGKWVRKHESDFPGFDVALLVTGEKLDEIESNLTSYQVRNSACTKQRRSVDESSNSIVLHSSSTWDNACAALGASLATVLGADADQDTSCSHDQFLMSNGHCGDKHHYFSKCSEAGIARFLEDSQSSCLRIENAPDSDILNSAKVTHPPTMTDQCKMLTGNMNAAVSNEEDTQCVRANCTLNVEGKKTFETYLFPLENSLCGRRPNSFCFRGRCIHQGQLLQNVYYGDCFRLFGLMSGRDSAYHAEVVDCIDSQSPPSLIRIDYNEAHGSRIVAHVLSGTGEETYEICLCSGNIYFPSLEFRICAEVDDSRLRWDAVKVEGTNMYLLRHRDTQLCLIVDENFQFPVANNCNETNRRHRWIVVEHTDVVPMEWIVSGNVSGFATRCTCVLIVTLCAMLTIM